MIGWQGIPRNALSILGTPETALMIGLIFALVGYHRSFPEDKTVCGFNGIFADALKTAGQIILIIGAGGAFSGVLKMSELQKVMTESFSGLTIGILAPFLLGALFRTGIGSATIAMMTAATMITPLLDILGLASTMGRIIALEACAAGAMMVFHGNDELFWVTAAASEMDTQVAYKVIPLISILQSVTALLMVSLLRFILIH